MFIFALWTLAAFCHSQGYFPLYLNHLLSYNTANVFCSPGSSSLHFKHWRETAEMNNGLFKIKTGSLLKRIFYLSRLFPWRISNCFNCKSLVQSRPKLQWMMMLAQWVKKDQLAIEISASTSFCIICLITCNYYNDSTCFADTKTFFCWSNI